MSDWFQQRRREFIAASFRQFGQIRRTDIAREFEVTLAVASKDIRDFLAEDPPPVIYDVTAKCYRLKEPDDA